MGSNSGGSLTRPIFVLGLGIIFGAVISFITKRKREEISTNQKTALEETEKSAETEEPVGCCGGGGGSCGTGAKSEEKVSQSSCGTGNDGGACGTGPCSTGNEISKVQKIHFLIGSKTGAASKFANDVHNYIQAFNTTIKCVKSDIDSATIQEIEEIFKNNESTLYVLFMASYPKDFCENYLAYFRENSTDWRVGSDFFSKSAGLIPVLLGDSTFGADLFCQPGQEMSKLFSKMGGQRSNWFCIDNLNQKPSSYFKEVCQLVDETITVGSIEEPVEDSDEEEISEDEAENEEIEIEDGTSCRSVAAVDVEDLGSVMPNMKKTGTVKPQKIRVKKEMISDKLRGALTKQGYHLVGSHSGVKICRWTKSQLRGRGGCYKHSFYGIESHRCMEATPSLACANKCVFCWRHHTNPVGTEWRWVTDKPEPIVDQMLAGHRQMIKQLRGVPGVTSEKMVEANNPIHCALSLVGEPIMYPHINEFVDYLHDKGISTYLVTNAQFPDAISTLPPITQLYASIDGSTKEELKAIDRPLHRDFWERFIKSLENMSNVCGRTVYRLTLVTGFNLSDAEGYADLVRIANPDFIEVKGVTYCGTSNNAELSMKNVPWHEQVIEFCSNLANLLPEYDIACEHEHSNCVLISHHRFKTENGWKTWIDYPKFQQLYDEWKNEGKKFRALDYSVETPSWAVYGSEERGFDPEMKRHHRNRKNPSYPPGSNAPQG